MELEESKEADATRSHKKLKQLWEAAVRHEEPSVSEWLIEAEKLVEMFRETRNLFTSRGVRT